MQIILEGNDAYEYLRMRENRSKHALEIKALKQTIDELTEENKSCLAELFNVTDEEVTPFDEVPQKVIESVKDAKITEASELMKAIDAEAPAQQYELKASLANPFEETTPDTVKVTTTTEKTYNKYYRWKDADIRAINACMAKPSGHSHRNLDYIKGRLPLEVTWRALKSRLSRMGISCKKGVAEWKNP